MIKGYLIVVLKNKYYLQCIDSDAQIDIFGTDFLGDLQYMQNHYCQNCSLQTYIVDKFKHSNFISNILEETSDHDKELFIENIEYYMPQHKNIASQDLSTYVKLERLTSNKFFAQLHCQFLFYQELDEFHLENLLRNTSYIYMLNLDENNVCVYINISKLNYSGYKTIEFNLDDLPLQLTYNMFT